MPKILASHGSTCHLETKERSACVPCEGGKPNKTKTKTNLKALSWPTALYKSKGIKRKTERGERNRKTVSKPKPKNYAC